MKIHTSLTRDQVLQAVRSTPDVFVHYLTEHGSQSADRAFNIVLSGSSPRRGQATIGDGDYHAATWDQWGVVLGKIYAADPRARIAGVYRDAADFHWQTSDRFLPCNARSLIMCLQHRWAPVPGGYAAACTHPCGAVKRWQR
jgi:hypothetical protein